MVLDELVAEMEARTGKSIHSDSAFVKILWDYAKSFFLLLYFIIQITKAAAERNELLRSAFIVEIGTGYMPEQSIFIDESAKDERTLSRRYGYSYVNTRARLRVAFDLPCN